MNQIKNNHKILSNLGLERVQNSSLLCKNTGIAVNYSTLPSFSLASIHFTGAVPEKGEGANALSPKGKNENNTILQEKELNTKNSVRLEPKSLNNELVNLYTQNNKINSSIAETKITTTQQKQKLLDLKKNIAPEINNKLETIKIIDSNKIVLQNGKAISKLKAKYLNVIDMFAPVQKTSITCPQPPIPLLPLSLSLSLKGESEGEGEGEVYGQEAVKNKINYLNRHLSNKNKNNITIKKTNNNKINLKFNKCSDNKISKLLKSLFKFNKDLASFQYYVYNFNSSNNKFLKNITSILNFSFVSMSSLISRPVLKISANKIVIHLFYYVKQLTAKKKRLNRKLRYRMRSKLRFILNSNKKNRFKYYNNYNNKYFLKNNIKQLKFLAYNLSKILKKPVTLDLVRLHYIFNDSQILAKSIGLLSNRMRKSFFSITQNTFRKANILNPFKIKILPNNQILPSFTTGIKVKFAGRLTRGRIIPKKTVKLAQEGALARRKANFVTTSRFTKKNKRGIFSVTVSVGHAFF
jgi:hypothetical protein